MNLGLIGGIIVRDPKAVRVDHEVPLFVHVLAEQGGHDVFESPSLSNGEHFDHVFANAGEISDYFCRIHGASMAGRVRVVAGARKPPRIQSRSKTTASTHRTSRSPRAPRCGGPILEQISTSSLPGAAESRPGA